MNRAIRTKTILRTPVYSPLTAEAVVLSRRIGVEQEQIRIAKFGSPTPDSIIIQDSTVSLKRGKRSLYSQSERELDVEESNRIGISLAFPRNLITRKAIVPFPEGDPNPGRRK